MWWDMTGGSLDVILKVLPKKGPQSDLSPWNCCPSHHPPHVLPWATAEVQGLALHFLSEGEAHDMCASSISVPDV